MTQLETDGMGEGLQADGVVEGLQAAEVAEDLQAAHLLSSWVQKKNLMKKMAANYCLTQGDNRIKKCHHLSKTLKQMTALEKEKHQNDDCFAPESAP